MKEFELYAEGPLCASCCSSLPPEEVLKRMNTLHHPSTMHGWQFSEDKTFRTGAPNPCPCDKAPDTHKHYLLNC